MCCYIYILAIVVTHNNTNMNIYLIYLILNIYFVIYSANSDRLCYFAYLQQNCSIQFITTQMNLDFCFKSLTQSNGHEKQFNEKEEKENDAIAKELLEKYDKVEDARMTTLLTATVDNYHSTNSSNPKRVKEMMEEHDVTYTGDTSFGKSGLFWVFPDEYKNCKFMQNELFDKCLNDKSINYKCDKIIKLKHVIMHAGTLMPVASLVNQGNSTVVNYGMDLGDKYLKIFVTNARQDFKCAQKSRNKANNSNVSNGINSLKSEEKDDKKDGQDDHDDTIELNQNKNVDDGTKLAIAVTNIKTEVEMENDAYDPSLGNVDELGVEMIYGDMGTGSNIDINDDDNIYQHPTTPIKLDNVIDGLSSTANNTNAISRADLYKIIKILVIIICLLVITIIIF